MAVVMDLMELCTSLRFWQYEHGALHELKIFAL
jgi:hypothetical protein